ncbi:class I poly(R)-hydroxyalkanoic acid synthase [Paracoccaceae bacterium]|nr:class I poly(R)-hydroxyalkanoic acid synthase [Paracoccaceae bacterium]
MQEENRNVKDDVTVGPREYKELLGNFDKIDSLTKRLVVALSSKTPEPEVKAQPSQELYYKASAKYFSEILSNPSKLIENQVKYYKSTLENWTNIQNDILKNADIGTKKELEKTDQGWDENLYFKLIKQHYTISSKIIEETIEDLDSLSKSDKKQISFFTKQMIEFFSPSNFLGTNPEALTQALETNGKSLVDGLENLVTDVENSTGDLTVSLTDTQAFEVGENLAITEGRVIFRNDLFELIHYKPLTETVSKTPLLIVPPWINKFYNLDLQPKNSFVKYALEEGIPTFIISWVNPGKEHSDIDFTQYIDKGFFEAAKVVKEITEQEKINCIGYCIGGTLLATALSYLCKKGNNFVNSATFFTTLTDFEDPGDLSLFITDEYLDEINRQIKKVGYMEGSFLAQTFSFLRSNDLVYGPAVRSYLMGKKPPRFDLLYWNGDSTNLPGKMALEYLNKFYKENQLSKGELVIMGERLSLKYIDIPIFVVATHTDHIAPWRSSFFGLNKSSGNKRFVLAGSGHIAGIINPAYSKKYGYWTNSNAFSTPDEWLKTADRHDGSWWPSWSSWIKARSSTDIPGYIPGSHKDYPSLGLAPGKYVMKNYK